MKRIVSILLSVIMITSTIPTVLAKDEVEEELEIYVAEDYYAVASITTEEVLDKIYEIRTLFPSGSHFTVDGETCTAHNKQDWCANCGLRGIVDNLYSNGNFNKTFAQTGMTNGYTCMAFARFVYYYLFGVNYSDSARGQHSTKIYAYENGEVTLNTQTPAVGDFVYWNNSYGQHRAIYLAHDNENIYVMDANGVGNEISVVSYDHAKSWSSLDYCEIWHYNNYYSNAISNISEGTYYIKSILNNDSSTLDIEGQSTEDMANVHLWTYHGGESQKFEIIKNGDYYNIKNVYTDKMLDIENTSGGKGVNVHQYSAHSGKSQKWFFVNAGDGYYNIWNATGYCLDVSDGDYDDGTNVQIWTGNGTASQKFKLVPVENKTYTITFNANGGSVSPTSKTVTYGEAYGTLPTPKRAGYVFDGWYTSASGGTKIYSNTVVTNASNHTLYAHWIKGYWCYGWGGGTGTYSINLSGAFEDDADWIQEQVDCIIQDGISYYSNDAGFEALLDSLLGKIILDYESVNGVLTVAVDEEISKHKVTFNANGGSVNTANKEVVNGGTCVYGELPTPTRSGYKFDGWYTSASGGTKITSSTNFTLKTNQTLYAHWTSAPTSIELDASLIEVSKETSLNADISVVTKDDALVWRLVNNVGVTPVNADPYHVKISFDGQNALAMPYIALGVKITGTNITKYDTSIGMASNSADRLWSKAYEYPADTAHHAINLTDYTKGGGNFSNGYADVTSDDEVGYIRIRLTENDVTLPEGATVDVEYVAFFSDSNARDAYIAAQKAHDEAIEASKTYTVTFDAKGGSVSPTSKSVVIGEKYGTLPTPTRDGYRFDGWYTAASGGTKITSTSIVNITSDHTLYAHWTANETYTVTYNANGGEGAPAAQTKTHDVALTLSTTAPTYHGYTFKGWSTSIGGAVEYQPGDIYTANEHKTLYAVWTPVTFNIIFDANGGSVSPASKIGTYGTAFGTFPTPTRNGYTFDGWYSYANGGNKIESTSIARIVTDITIYAHWTENEPEVINVTGVSLNKTTATLTVEDTLTLTATVAPSNATDKTVTWTSSNPSIASVSNGVVTAKRAGTTTITATTVDGNKTANCVVTVNAIDDDLPSLKIDDITVTPGEDFYVDIVAENCGSVKAITVNDIEYSESLTLTQAEWLLSGSTLSSVDINGDSLIAFQNAIDANKAVMRLYFTVDSEATDGYAYIRYKAMGTDASNKNFDFVEYEGTVTIRSFIIGDCDSDEEITIDDAIYLAFYTFYSDRYPIPEGMNVDFDKDGVVTVDDAIYLAFHTFYQDRYPLN